MVGEVVVLKKSTEQIADDETTIKDAMLRWASDLASQVIQAALEDAAIPFIDGFNDEELGAFDLLGQEYDPVIDEKTRARLSDEIEEFAEKIQQPKETLRHLYKSALKARWKQGKQEIPPEPVGTRYGDYTVNRHGVWTEFKDRIQRRIARSECLAENHSDKNRPRGAFLRCQPSTKLATPISYYRSDRTEPDRNWQ
jgi:hypothetical protein